MHPLLSPTGVCPSPARLSWSWPSLPHTQEIRCDFPAHSNDLGSWWSGVYYPRLILDENVTGLSGFWEAGEVWGSLYTGWRGSLRIESGLRRRHIVCLPKTVDKTMQPSINKSHILLRHYVLKSHSFSDPTIQDHYKKITPAVQERRQSGRYLSAHRPKTLKYNPPPSAFKASVSSNAQTGKYLCMHARTLFYSKWQWRPDGRGETEGALFPAIYIFPFWTAFVRRH